MSRLRWFPEKGDLVLIHVPYKLGKVLTRKYVYGVVVRESIRIDSSFKGAWWDVFYSGIIVSITIQTFSPLWDKEGACLVTNCD